MRSQPSPADIATLQPTHKKFQRVFDTQRTASRIDPFPSLALRLERLTKLEKLLLDNQESIAAAICEDYGNRSIQETRMLELYNVVSGIVHVKKRLKKWMKPQRRDVGLAFFGARNTVVPQPKGVVGVVTPWNYPLFLSLGPCVSAIAAGNRCVVKLAAKSQTLANVLDKLVNAVFDESELAIIPGVSAGEFTHKPWDHLVFTGSSKTAKKVMETAAKTLTPLTLELGGKSPTIIADDYNLEVAAKRILFAKYLNAGQTCVAPDYVFLPRAKVPDFVNAAKSIVSALYPSVQTQDYTSIVDMDAFDRLTELLKDAEQQGAKVINLLDCAAVDPDNRKISPHLVLDPSDETEIMSDEIFGPLLPIKPYDDITEVLEYINTHKRPLALYLYSNDRALQKKVTYQTMSGGICINDSLLHVAQHDMPFGGIGNSGMGHYHGFEGFTEFSKLRPIFKQGPISSSSLLNPPYGKKFNFIMSMLLKFKL